MPHLILRSAFTMLKGLVHPKIGLIHLVQRYNLIGYHSVRVISLAIFYEKRMTRRKQMKGNKCDQQLNSHRSVWLQCWINGENDRTLVNDVLQWKKQKIINGLMIFTGPKKG